jgi:hypothetical protein
MGQRGEIFTVKIPSENENRSYFINLKENRRGELYLALVESKKISDADFERHQVVLFEEDFALFEKGVNRIFSYIREHKEKGKSDAT